MLAQLPMLGLCLLSGHLGAFDYSTPIADHCGLFRPLRCRALLDYQGCGWYRQESRFTMSYTALGTSYSLDHAMALAAYTTKLLTTNSEGRMAQATNYSVKALGQLLVRCRRGKSTWGLRPQAIPVYILQKAQVSTNKNN